jgi:hypothetical protein
MSRRNAPFAVAEYTRMARELKVMADAIGDRPEMRRHFAERLVLLAKQMAEDWIRAHPEQTVTV